MSDQPTALNELMSLDWANGAAGHRRALRQNSPLLKRESKLLSREFPSMKYFPGGTVMESNIRGAGLPARGGCSDDARAGRGERSRYGHEVSGRAFEPGILDGRVESVEARGGLPR